MTMPDIAISPAEWEIVRNILQRMLPEREVWAFGSRVRQNHKPYSDLDLAVLGEHALTMQQLAALSDAFSASDLPWKVDVVDWFSATETFRRIIESEKVVLQKISLA